VIEHDAVSLTERFRAPRRLTVTALDGMPLVAPGDALAPLIAAALEASAIAVQDDDVIVVAQKIVSKSEGRLVHLADVEPGGRALQLARELDKDPRMVQLVLDESTEIVRLGQGVLIVEHRQGFVMANAGIDQSNVPPGYALLLPEDVQRSTAALAEGLCAVLSARVAVIVSDSVGRAWRNGTMGQALGVAGLPGVVDLRGDTDMYGRELRVSEIALADCIAAAASLVMGESGERRPVALVRGLEALAAGSTPERPLTREKTRDLFR
jgi:coenzyme F420-0:L-glutamate ligase / coenzyme F420-1:gamma-L-glutamate ligase